MESVYVDRYRPHTHYRGMSNQTHPTVIAFASPKGGVGKSTLCLSFAGALAARRETVIVVDFDATGTLLRWFTTNPSAQTIPGLTVRAGCSLEQLPALMEDIFNSWQGYVLLDLAGAFTTETLFLSAFAALTITPAKLNEPDVVEAFKLYDQVKDLRLRTGSPVIHRVLINELPSSYSNLKKRLAAQLEKSDLGCFATRINHRVAYEECFAYGNTPHFADRSRETVAKAVAEIDTVLDEALSIIANKQERAAA